VQPATGTAEPQCCGRAHDRRVPAARCAVFRQLLNVVLEQQSLGCAHDFYWPSHLCAKSALHVRIPRVRARRPARRAACCIRSIVCVRDCGRHLECDLVPQAPPWPGLAIRGATGRRLEPSLSHCRPVAAAQRALMVMCGGNNGATKTDSWRRAIGFSVLTVDTKPRSVGATARRGLRSATSAAASA